MFKALPLGYDLVLVDSVTGCRNRGTMVRGQQSVEEWRAKAADSVSVVSLPSPLLFKPRKCKDHQKLICPSAWACFEWGTGS